MTLKFSWFPGHMQQTLRQLEREEKMASMAIMVLDARCPRSTRNPQLEQIFRKKPLLYVINKEDLASQKITGLWLESLKEEGLNAISLSSKTGSGKKRLFDLIDQFKDKFEKENADKHRFGLFRIVVVGLPNTGKSSVINLLSPQKSVKTGKKPGLTRGKQWLKVKSGIEVLDSPGVMIPRMDLEDTPWILGTIAAIKQEILPVEDIAIHFIKYLLDKNLFPDELADKPLPEDPRQVLAKVALKRGFILKGGDPDTEKAALHLLKIFREGKIGKITLETPF